MLCVLGRFLLHNEQYVVCTGEDPAAYCRIYFVYWGGFCYIMYSMWCVLGRILLHSVENVVYTGEYHAA
jgi:hypothetical protein